ncbi:MAG: hypothetical protein NUV98_05515 [Candidatus Roizmanbacteria bacterium]|nr:hypothetical protein [Candidatus Roizmanbacteria bacterium]
MKKEKKEHVTSESVTNLYRFSNRQDPESLDLLYISGTLPTNYIAIALKEWFFSVKKDGLLIITYSPKDTSVDWIEKQFWWLFHGTYRIIEHTAGGEWNRLTVQKTTHINKKGDSITKWTFGIVTNGDRNEWVERMIVSIRKQKIPSYEIIICGNYYDRKEKDVVYIPFNERADRGWITRKKNLICEHARFENICVLHDRIVLDSNWLSGMKRYGNTFELLGCVQIDAETGVQAGDWITNGGPIETEYSVSRLDYEDWDPFVYVSGQLTIIKRYIWKEILWDETRYWNNKEDTDITFRARDAGYVTRFNPHATTTALAWRHGKLPIKYNPEEGIMPKDMLLRRAVRSAGRFIYTIPFIRRLISSVFKTIERTPVYRHIQHH